MKNIPKHITEARLKAHFATKGEVTDVKIMKTKYVTVVVELAGILLYFSGVAPLSARSVLFRDGRSRKFGFIGFTSVDAAKEAKMYFDNTYVDTSKISIEYALPVRSHGNS